MNYEGSPWFFETEKNITGVEEPSIFSTCKIKIPLPSMIT